MIRKLGQEVRKHFDLQMKERLPQFVRYTAPSPEPGLRLYRWEFADDLFFFVALCRSIHTEAFTVEIASTSRPHWEPHGMVAGPTNEPRNGFVHFRLNDLLGQETRQWDLWWDFGPPTDLGTSADADPAARLDTFLKYVFFDSDAAREAFVACALPLVPSAVSEAIDYVVKYANPYFEGVAQRYGGPDMRKQPTA